MNDPVSSVRSMIEVARESELSFLAGSIAFFAFFSILPTLLIVLAVGSMIGGEAFAMRIVELFESYLSAEGSAVINEALTNPDGVVGASIVGFFGLVWSALKVFRAIDLAFDRIYETEMVTSLPRQLLNAAVVLVAIIVGITLLITVQALVARLVPGLSEYSLLIGIPVTIGVLIVAFAPLYYVMPPRQVSVRHVVPGVLTAVGGLILLQQLFRVYAAHADQYQAYGFLGVVLLFLLWLYFGAIVLLFGAVVNAVISN